MRGTVEVRAGSRRVAVGVPVVVALAAGLLGTLVFYVAFFYRLDCAAHFAGGFGLTTALLALIGPGRAWTRSWTLAAAGLVAFTITLVVGLVTELTIFASLLPDPMDVGNQMFGAVVAAAVFAGEGRRGPGLRLPLLAVGAAMIALAFVLRYGPLGAFTWFR